MYCVLTALIFCAMQCFFFLTIGIFLLLRCTALYVGSTRRTMTVYRQISSAIHPRFCARFTPKLHHSTDWIQHVATINLPGEKIQFSLVSIQSYSLRSPHSIMFRKLGFGSGKSKKRPKKKRLSPAAHERIGDDGSSVGTTPPPSYQYAMNEYALTGPSAATRRPTSLANVDDEGYIRPSYSMTDVEEHDLGGEELEDLNDGADFHDESTAKSNIRLNAQQEQQQRQTNSGNPTPPSPSSGQPQSREGILRTSSQKKHSDSRNVYDRRRYLSPQADYFSYDEDDAGGNVAIGGNNDDDDNSTRGPSMLKQSGSGSGRSLPSRGSTEQMMPDATYEEWYGDAYVGGPIRYIYPSGYQSMRPRGGPWKLSIVVCLLFTWLSVFIIGHCSALYEQNQMNNNNYDNAYDDDNAENHVINEKWCGSRLLYWMWVMSMLITGLASAYCGVIGYIKVRDFAVANTRSQPPGIMMVGDYSLSTYGDSRTGGGNNKGNSDYYVPISDADVSSRQRYNQHQQTLSTTNYRVQQTHPAQYSKTIYQADGTPQFWGNQIYRPNQAAVHTVSR